MTDLFRRIRVNGRDFRVVSLPDAGNLSHGQLGTLPFSLRILLENALRHAQDQATIRDILDRFIAWRRNGGTGGAEIPFHPARILTPESGGLPLLADLAAMRDAAAKWGSDPTRVNPAIPIDLIVDHSLVVDESGHSDACIRNEELEMARNSERFAFLKWAQQAFDNLRVVPPGFGICHQINFEHLSPVVQIVESADGPPVLIPDTLLGLDSHTPTINALGVVGWGVGGIEAVAALLGEPVNVRLPRVVGCKLVGTPPAGFVATDLALRVVEALRETGVVGDFVEFFGPGVDRLSGQDRATVANMTPEYGATIGFFPCDERTLSLLAATGHTPDRISLAHEYLAYQGLLAGTSDCPPEFAEVVEVNLATVGKCVAGPRRPHERIKLSDVAENARMEIAKFSDSSPSASGGKGAPAEETIGNGLVAIAALASCTNMVNPRTVIAAALLARNAAAKGLTVKPWVKTSLTLGSPVLAKALSAAGLMDDLSKLGFQIAGFGCATCLGNSGPLKPAAAQAVSDQGMAAWAVVSSNRNFEGRIHPQCRLGYLTSPPLVVAYALAGTVTHDLTTVPLGRTLEGRDVLLSDIWPDETEIAEIESRFVTPDLFRDSYANLRKGKPAWEILPAPTGKQFSWPDSSNYLKRPPLL